MLVEALQSSGENVTLSPGQFGQTEYTLIHDEAHQKKATLVLISSFGLKALVREVMSLHYSASSLHLLLWRPLASEREPVIKGLFRWK